MTSKNIFLCVYILGLGKKKNQDLSYYVRHKLSRCADNNMLADADKDLDLF